MTTNSTAIDEFRIATVDDVPSIVCLVNHAYRPESGQSGWTHESNLIRGDRTNASQVIELLSLANSVVLIALSQKKIVGCVHLRIEAEQCHIGMLAVDPILQNSGIGNHLLAYAESYAAKQYACETFVMAVLSARPELIAFYVRRGYRETGDVLNYPHEMGVGSPLQQNLKLMVLEKTNKLTC